MHPPLLLLPAPSQPRPSSFSPGTVLGFTSTVRVEPKSRVSSPSITSCGVIDSLGHPVAGRRAPVAGTGAPGEWPSTRPSSATRLVGGEVGIGRVAWGGTSTSDQSKSEAWNKQKGTFHRLTCGSGHQFVQMAQGRLRVEMVLSSMSTRKGVRSGSKIHYQHMAPLITYHARRSSLRQTDKQTQELLA